MRLPPAREPSTACRKPLRTHSISGRLHEAPSTACRKDLRMHRMRVLHA